MDHLRSTSDALGAMRDQFESMMSAGSRTGSAASSRSQLHEVEEFGRNPGKLRMYKYVPDSSGSNPALVVALHGCTQTAAGYDEGSGWSTMAERHGFALLMPEQQSSNNPNLCFNWFEPGHTRRGGGEAMSISQMIKSMIEEHAVDPARVFVLGLSAGGAMSAAVLAAYPEMFAAGAVLAGLPAGAAGNLREAMDAMRRGTSMPPRELGDIVRRAAPHEGAYPRLSVWHGDSDSTVHPQNAENLVQQWGNVHGLAIEPGSDEQSGRARRRVWRDESGRAVLESYTLAGMGHGVALGLADEDDRCGRPGMFQFDVGISSAAEIVRFFGIAQPGAEHGQHATSKAGDDHVRADAEPVNGTAAPVSPTTEAYAAVADALRRAGLLAEGAKRSRPAGTGAIDPAEIITRTLKAAGILKS